MFYLGLAAVCFAWALFLVVPLLFLVWAILESLDPDADDWHSPF